MKRRLIVWILAILCLAGCTAPAVRTPNATNAKKTPPPPKTVRVVAFGDFMLHRPQLDAAKGPEGYDFKENFRYLRPYIDGADLAMINLETTLTDGSRGYTTYPVFSSPKEVARDFKETGFDVISTANNHAYDKLKDGLDYTYDVLKEQDLDVVGTGKERAEPLVKEVNGIRLGILSYTYGLNGFDGVLANSENPESVRLLTRERVQEDVVRLNEEGVDLILSYVHWGEEYRKEANDDQKEKLKMLADAGVALVLGSHPHVPQGIDNVVGKEMTTFCAYSMGNFVSNQRRNNMGGRRTDVGQMVTAQIIKDESGTRIAEFMPKPLYVDKYVDGGLHYEVIPAEAALLGEIPVERIETLRPVLEETVADHTVRISPDLLLSNDGI